MKTRVSRSILMILGTMILFSYSCSKYDEGPLICLRSKKARVVNDWKLKFLIRDGKSHEFFKPYPRFEFTATEFICTDAGGNSIGKGEWIFSEDMSSLNVQGQLENVINPKFEIKKLKHRSFNFEVVSGNNITRYELID